MSDVGTRSRAMQMRILMSAVFLAAFALAGCGEDQRAVKFGAKNFGESRILAHMMAALAEQQGLQVHGVIDYPSTQAIMVH